MAHFLKEGLFKIKCWVALAFLLPGIIMQGEMRLEIIKSEVKN